MRDKIKRFCKEYIIDNNGTQAAIRSEYSAATAVVQASRLLARPDVQEYIAELKAKQSKRLEINADNVLEQYRRLAFADINDYYHNVYELRYISGSDNKEYRQQVRIRKHLKRNYGTILSEDKYAELPTKYQSFYTADEVLKSFDLLTKEQRAAIAGITYDKSGRPILKLSSKETSLDALSKHLGIFEKDNEQSAASIKINMNEKLSDDELEEEIKKRGLPLHLMTSTS